VRRVLPRKQGKRSEAEPLFREVLALQRKVQPAGHHEIAHSWAGLGAVLAEPGRAQEAEPLLRECLEIRRKSLPERHVLIAQAQSLLGGCLTEQARYAEAEPLLLSFYELLETTKGVQPAVLRMARERIVRLYEASGKPEKA